MAITGYMYLISITAADDVNITTSAVVLTTKFSNLLIEPYILQMIRLKSYILQINWSCDSLVK